MPGVQLSGPTRRHSPTHSSDYGTVRTTAHRECTSSFRGREQERQAGWAAGERGAPGDRLTRVHPEVGETFEDGAGGGDEFELGDVQSEAAVWADAVCQVPVGVRPAEVDPVGAGPGLGVPVGGA